MNVNERFSFSSHSCEDDYVIIDEPIQGKAKKLCGNQIPKAFNISSNELKIAFKSAERIGRPKPGFVATYTSGTTPGKRVLFCMIHDTMRLVEGAKLGFYFGYRTQMRIHCFTIVS